MACVFITPGPKYSDTPLTKLTVNHMDGVKSNNVIDNLEWMTNKENATHSRETGLNSIWNEGGLDNPATKPLLGRVVVKGPYEGLEFVVMGYRDAVRSGFYSAGRVARGKVSNSKGCDFKFISKEEASLHKHFLDLEKDQREYLKLSTKEKENYSSV